MSSKPISVLITGANRGLGLEMVRQMVETQSPIRALFACCRDPGGPRAEALQALAKKHKDPIKVICITISVLITGANRGLGLEMVRQMVEIQKPPPRLLFACCRDPDGATQLQALKKEHPDIIKIIHLDAAGPTSIKQAAVQVGSIIGTTGLNLIINNAAVAVHQSLLDSSPEDMHRCFNTNTIGPMLVIQEFIPFLRAAAKDCGSPGLSCCKAAVINISTFYSSNELTKESYKDYAVMPYRVSKAALNMLSVCASVELRKHEILCAMLHPGWVRTDMGGKDGELGADESVEGMLHVMSSMTEQHCGTLWDWRGQTVPW